VESGWRVQVWGYGEGTLLAWCSAAPDAVRVPADVEYAVRGRVQYEVRCTPVAVVRCTPVAVVPCRACAGGPVPVTVQPGPFMPRVEGGVDGA
jgi:hypothetical protein